MAAQIEADRRIVDVCSLFYEHQASKTEIANSLNISITHVNRLLKEAQAKGIVKITIQSPRFEKLESEIMRRFALRDVRVVEEGQSQELLRSELGREAASLFERIGSDEVRVGVSSGRTIFEMASFVSEKPRKISIFPLNVILERDPVVRGLSANTVATILWFKSRPHAAAKQVEMFFPNGDLASLRKRAGEILQAQPLRELAGEIQQLDAYFLGAGELRQGSQVHLLSRLCGMDLPDLTERGIVGDVAFNMLDVKGSQVRIGIEDLLFHVKAEHLKAAAASTKKVVALLAGGAEKVPCIKAALEGTLFNVLITDSGTAQAIIDHD
jgi:DNA-binding transcriptional regulator LsrR (DeoR family)